MKTKLHLGLLPRILIAMAAGIIAGTSAPMWLARVFATFNSIFSEFLGFIIPLLIVGFVAPAIFDIGRKAGKMLVATALIAYAMTFASGMMSYYVSDLTFPSIIKADAYMATRDTSLTIAPYFTIEIEPLMNVMTALVLAFMIGLCLARIESGYLRHIMLDIRQVINLTIVKVIIPLLPIYIFGIFLSMTLTGEVGQMLKTFAGIIIVIFAMHVGLLIVQYLIASLFSGLNPFKALWRMMPAYFTALGTQSSAATIPVTLRQTESLGVDKDTAGFVIPLCATIHMSGSTLKIVACALALMISHSMPYSTETFAGFIAMLGITIVAAPGIPGGAIMASLGLLSSMLGFTDADNALMIALYIAMDNFGTACNVTGDGAIAQIVDRLFRQKTAQ
jgi:Na+/H+-dicarboxylate symporter